MRSKIKNVNKLGPKILDKSLFSHNYNTYSTFFFRFDTILAHTQNIQLVNSNKFDGFHLLKSLGFQKVVRLNDNQMMPQTMEELIKDKNQTVKPADIHQQLNPLLKREAHLNLSVEKSSAMNELVYIQSNDSIIEK